MQYMKTFSLSSATAWRQPASSCEGLTPLTSKVYPLYLKIFKSHQEPILESIVDKVGFNFKGFSALLVCTVLCLGTL